MIYQRNKLLPMKEDGRRYPRVNVEWPVTLQTDRGSMDGIALNISSGGAFVRFKELVPKGETLDMTLKPPNHTPLKVTIETMWTDKYIPSGKEIKPIGIGVRFAKVSDVDRQFVSTVVADLLKLEHVKESCERLFSASLRLHAKICGLTLGILTGLAIFVATNWLVIKGGHITPNGEYVVGPHLRLLSQYFIGYKVSFWGSIIGFFYGFGFGALCGAAIGWFYNKITKFRN